MNRKYRLANLWSWLPAFRTVAETQHLPSAARAMHVTPSALSRSIKNIEDALGQSLFTREERRIKLNRNGEILLGVVQEAMRSIDHGLHQITAPASDRLRVAGPPTWLQLVLLPVVHQLRRAGVRLVVDVADVTAEQTVAALVRGDLDVALHEAFVASDDLLVEELGEISYVVCCGRDRDRATSDAPFAIHVDGHDPWPPQVPRKIALWSPHLSLVIEECAAGGMKAVVPRAVAHAFDLRTTDRIELPSSRLYALRRRGATPPVSESFLHELRACATRVLHCPVDR